MGHYARGDSRKMICSSDEEEGYRTTSQNPSRTNSIMSRMNQRDKRNLILGTFGEAPPLPLPPVSDETDRQFWAEDELSSCESRNLVITKRKRRHSVAYRNRAAVHRSRSGFVQSSSSSTETARPKIPPSVRRRQRLRNCPGTSRMQRTKVANSGIQTKLNAKTVSRLVEAGNSLVSGCDIIQPTVRDRRFNLSIMSRRQNSQEGNEALTSENATTLSRTPSKSGASNVGKNRVSKIRLPAKSRRK